MPTFQQCDPSIPALALEILTKFPSHKPLLDARVKVDYLFAFPDYDEKTGMAKNDAIRRHGCKTLGVCRILPLKQRVKSMGDAEILLDGAWWKEATEEERAALLDHELHHLVVRCTSFQFSRKFIAQSG